MKFKKGDHYNFKSVQWGENGKVPLMIAATITEDSDGPIVYIRLDLDGVEFSTTEDMVTPL